MSLSPEYLSSTSDDYYTRLDQAEEEGVRDAKNGKKCQKRYGAEGQAYIKAYWATKNAIAE